MSEADSRTPVNSESLPDPGELPGVIRALGELGPTTIIMEEALAKMFDRHPTSIKRAVHLGELPSPYRLFGGNAARPAMTTAG